MNVDAFILCRQIIGEHGVNDITWISKLVLLSIFQ